jgi:hypothetical protein
MDIKKLQDNYAIAESKRIMSKGLREQLDLWCRNEPKAEMTTVELMMQIKQSTDNNIADFKNVLADIGKLSEEAQQEATVSYIKLAYAILAGYYQTYF